MLFNQCTWKNFAFWKLLRFYLGQIYGIFGNFITCKTSSNLFLQTSSYYDILSSICVCIYVYISSVCIYIHTCICGFFLFLFLILVCFFLCKCHLIFSIFEEFLDLLMHLSCFVFIIFDLLVFLVTPSGHFLRL